MKIYVDLFSAKASVYGCRTLVDLVHSAGRDQPPAPEREAGPLRLI